MSDECVCRAARCVPLTNETARPAVGDARTVDAVDRLTDNVGVALGVAQSVGGELDKSEHRQLGRDALLQLVGAMRGLCVLLYGRAARRHANAGACHAVDKLLSLLAEYRESLDDQAALDALQQLTPLYRKRLALPDEPDEPELLAAHYAEEFQRMLAERDVLTGSDSPPRLEPLDAVLSPPSR